MFFDRRISVAANFSIALHSTHTLLCLVVHYNRIPPSQVYQVLHQDARASLLQENFLVLLQLVCIEEEEAIEVFFLGLPVLWRMLILEP